MPVKRIVCLANSRKEKERCVAGKEYADGNLGHWVRPVGGGPSGEVGRAQTVCTDGQEARALDIIDVSVVEPRPKGCQTENWLIEAGQPWQCVGSMSAPDLARFADLPDTLWLNGCSSKGGFNDRVPEELSRALASSLFLLKLDSARITVSTPGASFGDPSKKARVSFVYRNVPYDLKLTDCVLELEYLAKPTGSYPLGPCLATVSLAEPWTRPGEKEAYCYKVVAALIILGADAP